MKKRTCLKIILMTIILFAFGGSISNAAITANSQTVNSGENVVISVKSTQALGAYTVTVSDNGGLKFVTSSGQEGSGKSVISGSSTTGTTSLATFTFQAPSVSENKTYVVKINATGMETPNLESVENSSISVNVTVKAQNNSSNNTSGNNNNNSNNNNNNNNNNNTAKSNNANLSNLIVSPVDFSGFKASKTSGYSVTVENDVTSVKITAKTQDSKAKVAISGDKNLKVGSNEVKVTVTAEDGTQKVYKVSVIRKDKTTEEVATTNNTNSNLTNENEPNEKVPEVNSVPQVDDELGITSLNIVGISNNNIEVEPRIEPSFSKDIYEYAVSVTSDIEKLKIDAITNLSDSTVEIMGNENLEQGENIVTILVKSNDGSKQQTYQIIVNKTDENLDLTHDSERDKRIILLIIVVILVVAVIIATIIIIRKKRSKDIKRIGTVGLNYNVFEDNDYEKNKNTSFNGKKVGKRFK